MDANSDTPSVDLERNQSEQGFLLNNTVHSLAWRQLIVTVKDRQTKKPKDLICGIDGSVEQGG